MPDKISEINIDERFIEMANNVLDSIRTIREAVTNGSVGNTYPKVNAIKDSVEKANFELGSYLVKLKEALEAYDLYMSVGSDLERVAQNLSAAAYRISIVMSKGYQMPDVIKVLLTTMLEKLISQAMTLIEGFRILSVNPTKAVEYMRQVKALEEDVDDIYRNSELKLFEHSADLLTTMLLKDVFDRLEDSSDAMLRIANSLYYISYLRA
ncbi:MAG: DUF47 domain-containing protein [Thermoprotei archaeon]